MSNKNKSIFFLYFWIIFISEVDMQKLLSINLEFNLSVISEASQRAYIYIHVIQYETVNSHCFLQTFSDYISAAIIFILVLIVLGRGCKKMVRSCRSCKRLKCPRSWIFNIIFLYKICKKKRKKTWCCIINQRWILKNIFASLPRQNRLWSPRIRR